MSVLRSTAILLLALAIGPLLAGTRYSSQPNPLGDEHLVIVRPDQFRTRGGEPAELSTQSGAVFEDQAVVVATPIASPLQVRFPGRYTLWVRAGAVDDRQVPLRVVLVRQDALVLSSIVNDGPGSPEGGGPAGYEAYVKRAVRDAPAGDAVTEVGVAARLELDAPDAAQKPGEAGGEDPFETFREEVRAETGEKWVTVHRVEARTKHGAYWWRIGTAELEPGRYALGLSPARPLRRGEQPLVDAAFLTTYSKLVYPFARDIDAPRASYVRFRIDGLPADGLSIRTHINTHGRPLGTPTVCLGPEGMLEKEIVKHTETGLTPWYRLQDIERCPAADSYWHQVQMLISVEPGPDKDESVRGITQFAMWPYADAVLREIDWREPSGRSVNMVMDFEKGLHRLKTFRDCAREDYERALANAEYRLFPLTDHDLFVGGSGPVSIPATHDYLCKTLRLLGYNIVYTYRDPVGSRKRYGWASISGGTKTFSPFRGDEPAVKDYMEYFAPTIQARPKFHEGVRIWMLCDEPGERYTGCMASPLWRYEEPEGEEPRWTDYAGASGLYTRKTDYANCVLEGLLALRGGWVEVRVAVDCPQKPSRYAFWRLGNAVPENVYPYNVLVNKVGLGEFRQIPQEREEMKLVNELTPFKVIYTDYRAAMFLREVLVHEFKDLPKRGGFGFYGGGKAVARLRFRPVRESDLRQLLPLQPQSVPGAETTTDAEVKELEAATEEPPSSLPDWAKPKPLKKFVEEDWVITGGVPDLHDDFRRWVKGHGVQPSLFGAKSWDDVKPNEFRSLARNPAEARIYYWTKRYASYLTPKIFALATEGLRRLMPDRDLWAFAGPNGGYPNLYGVMPLDLIELATHSNGMMPGISDRGADAGAGPQANAFQAALFNAGARRYGQAPVSKSVMHVCHPTVGRAYAALGTGVKYLSYFTFGPYYLGQASDPWSQRPWCYEAASKTDNRATQVADILGPGRLRPSRVAMLYARSTDYWHTGNTFFDKRATFVALAHEHYQPDLVTEPQVAGGALAHYDALYVLDSHVAAGAQQRIADWVKEGGLLWCCADAARKNEYDEPLDLLAEHCGIKRTRHEEESKPAATDKATVVPVPGEATFRPHDTTIVDRPKTVVAERAAVRARYDGGRPAWLESKVGKGRVVYIAHRPGLRLANRRLRYPQTVWPEIGRELITGPLHSAGVDRELTVSVSRVFAAPVSTDDGTVIVLYNLLPYPLNEVALSLKEPARPHSVQVFDGLKLKALPYKYSDGRVHMTVTDLADGTMIVVRRRPAPPDDRDEREQRRIGGLFKSSDPLDLAAACWFAGLRPGWKMAGRVVRFLQHERWEVRAAAAEALGRLQYEKGGSALMRAKAVETDAHASGEQVLALGRMGHADALATAFAAIDHRDVFVRKQAVRAVSALLGHDPAGAAVTEELPNEMRPAGLRMAERALADRDLRTQAEGMKLVAALDVPRTLAHLLNAFESPNTSPDEQNAWADLVGERDGLFAAYLKQGLPGGDDLLLAVARRRRHPALVSALKKCFTGITKSNRGAWLYALVRQADKALTRAIFDARDRIPDYNPFLPYTLECTFRAGVGTELGDWEKYLAETVE